MTPSLEFLFRQPAIRLLVGNRTMFKSPRLTKRIRYSRRRQTEDPPPPTSSSGRTGPLIRSFLPCTHNIRANIETGAPNCNRRSKDILLTE
ncbi:hypothetical protein CDAR_119961 [Caerostris darwini]|uniref:Ycf15 n=1 Tax=Caerostris darwini TaxID=1538125 RepID=A0AAV4T4F6_9ARAC|nr:hypothetical protein CDAR_119961 [Caerostris darwini]